MLQQRQGEYFAYYHDQFSVFLQNLTHILSFRLFNPKIPIYSMLSAGLLPVLVQLQAVPAAGQ